MSSNVVPSGKELESRWARVLGHLEVEMIKHAYTTWMIGTRPLGLTENTLVVESPRGMNCEWLNGHLGFVVSRAAAAQFGAGVTVRFVPRGAAGALESSPDTVPAPGPSAVVGSANTAARTAPEPERMQPVLRPAPAVLLGRMNGAYTFDRYVQAEGNRLAYQSCAALLGRGGPPVKRVTLYGPPGMGKTHLLHALAREAHASGQVVACLGGEDFVRRFVDEVRFRATTEFLATLRTVQLLVVDDLQEFERAPKSADELVRAIDAVSDAGGAVAIGSEKLPRELDIPERLKSRLQEGLTVRVDPFKHADRLAYARQVAAELGSPLPGWAIERIANTEMASVRCLRGAVSKAAARHCAEQLSMARLDEDLALLAIESARATRRSGMDERELILAVAHHFATTFDEIVGRARKPALADARAVVTAVLHERGATMKAIGEMLGGRDKGTVSPTAERGRALIAADEGLRALLAS